jgi:phosphoglycolate phosphatase-like HAD superfamily hydrolase
MGTYRHYTSEIVHPVRSYGSYFPAVCADPTKYYQAQPELRETLERINESGVKLFLASNSHSENVEMIMEATLGTRHWKDYFDVVVAHAVKPQFQIEEKSFWTLDQ